MSKSKITAPIQELLEMYRGGLNLKQIGEKFDASREAVRQYFKRYGVEVMEERRITKNSERSRLKPLADKLLIDSCNRTVKGILEKKRRVEALLRHIKKTRIELISSVDKTLIEIQKTCDLGLNNKKQSLLALKVVKGLIAKQQEEFEQYKNMMNSYSTEE